VGGASATQHLHLVNSRLGYAVSGHLIVGGVLTYLMPSE
jgi:hypothetical protein